MSRIHDKREQITRMQKLVHQRLLQHYWARVGRLLQAKNLPKFEGFGSSSERKNSGLASLSAGAQLLLETIVKVS
jgi:hypothetical protein